MKNPEEPANQSLLSLLYMGGRLTLDLKETVSELMKLFEQDEQFILELFPGLDKELTSNLISIDRRVVVPGPRYDTLIIKSYAYEGPNSVRFIYYVNIGEGGPALFEKYESWSDQK